MVRAPTIASIAADDMPNNTGISVSRSNRDEESILLKLSEDEGDKVIAAYAMLPLKDDDRPVDSWKG